MAERSDRLRELCHTYAGALEHLGIDPVMVEAFRRLIRNSLRTKKTASELWHDNVALRREIAQLRGG